MEEMQITTAPAATLPVNEETIKKMTEILKKYKTGKARTEQRITASENWWKKRNDVEEGGQSAVLGGKGFKAKSGWLHNVITSKHADAMEAYPEPVILPREEADKGEARILTSIIPCILEQVDFEKTYSAANWQKGKTGTACYKVVWDSHKHNGLGDIAISRVNLLNVYWEPGVEDIQQSRYFFSTELVDKDVLKETYPQLQDKLNGQGFMSTKFLYDDTVDTSDKATVVECYYHKMVEGRNTLQYIKWVDSTVLYATENEPDMAQRGLYDHGRYPYEFDALFPIEGSPCGYGYVDICRDPQLVIDLLNTSFVKNAQVGATPRFFIRGSGGVNKGQFLDLDQALVNVEGNMGDDDIRQIPFSPLPPVYVSFMDRMVQELRETSGNTETSTGNISSGVTAASAIAALQEASGKGSRDSNKSAYRTYVEIIKLCIELIRQFYDVPRTFRITGSFGEQQFVTYTNTGIKEQYQGEELGMDMGYRLPEFDIKVSAQKKDVYTRVSQNELALQFFQMGFFNPQMTDQALMCLGMMDFEGKDGIMQAISRNGTMFQKLVQYMQLALTLAAQAAPQMVQKISADIMQTLGQQADSSGGLPQMLTHIGEESGVTRNARERSAASTQPEGGRVTGGARG